ncbi:hypothetical protein RCC89_11130 [Cytophagaceae bacterium ABcell3]|nr:hypothetical protein RCC89_11130 [Cytophagaceae bacterium ABcell3]
MFKAFLYFLSVLFIIKTFIGCQTLEGDSENNSQSTAWLSGTEEEKFVQIENHLRGFDVAMAETGYRYTELYWAGKDLNWEYADYQAGKIERTIELAMERRPRRANTAEAFLSTSLEEVKEAIAQEDSAVFAESFQSLTQGCNNCHSMEGMDFVNIEIPNKRTTPVRKNKN